MFDRLQFTNSPGMAHNVCGYPSRVGGVGLIKLRLGSVLTKPPNVPASKPSLAQNATHHLDCKNPQNGADGER